MSNKELVAGDTVWSETSHYTNNQSKRQVRQATITKVSRLYYEVKVGGSKPLKFEKGNLRAKDWSERPQRIWLSLDAFNQDVQRETLRQEVREATSKFQFNLTYATYDELLEIQGIYRKIQKRLDDEKAMANVGE